MLHLLPVWHIKQFWSCFFLNFLNTPDNSVHQKQTLFLPTLVGLQINWLVWVAARTHLLPSKLQIASGITLWSILSDISFWAFHPSNALKASLSVYQNLLIPWWVLLVSSCDPGISRHWLSSSSILKDFVTGNSAIGICADGWVLMQKRAFRKLARMHLMYSVIEWNRDSLMLQMNRYVTVNWEWKNSQRKIADSNSTSVFWLGFDLWECRIWCSYTMSLR